MAWKDSKKQVTDMLQAVHGMNAHKYTIPKSMVTADQLSSVAMASLEYLLNITSYGEAGRLAEKVVDDLDKKWKDAPAKQVAGTEALGYAAIPWWKPTTKPTLKEPEDPLRVGHLLQEECEYDYHTIKLIQRRFAAEVCWKCGTTPEYLLAEQVYRCPNSSCGFICTKGWMVRHQKSWAAKNAKSPTLNWPNEIATSWLQPQVVDSYFKSDPLLKHLQKDLSKPHVESPSYEEIEKTYKEAMFSSNVGNEADDLDEFDPDY